MAAPDSTSILNMAGSWSLNYVHSDDLGPTFQLVCVIAYKNLTPFLLLPLCAPFCFRLVLIQTSS